MRNLPMVWRANDPFSTMQRAMDDTLASYFGEAHRAPGVPQPVAAGGKTFAPLLDVHVSDTDMTISTELPGLDDKDVPFEVDREKIEATFKKGVLDVRLPKSAAAKNESRRITIKGG